jgi:acetyl esterase/lipase
MAMTGGVSVEESSAGPIVRPPDPAETLILYVHGDRYFSSDPESALDTAGNLALRTGGTVLCARYRPVFPAALEDVQAAYRLAQSLGPVVAVGERLGAGLVAALLLWLRDRGEALPGCAVLVSGLFDLTLQAPSLLFNAGDPAFDADEFRRRAASYADGTAPDEPLLSPLFGNLHGLPPIRLLAAGSDPLLDDSLIFAARAARSGLTVELLVQADLSALQREFLPAISAFIAAWRPAGGAGRPARLQNA